MQEVLCRAIVTLGLVQRTKSTNDRMFSLEEGSHERGYSETARRTSSK
jgi:hypothetical protein